MTNAGELFAEFVRIIAALRHPETGCPWDLKQTHESLRSYAIEEAYEVVDAIDQADDEALSGELGDLLLQVVLHSQVASDRKAFTVETVLTKINEKMIRRHPHVFGDTKVADAGEVLKNWDEIKRLEKGAAKKPEGLLSGIPRSLPALFRAHQLGVKSGTVDFDWDSAADAWKKVEEELAEVQAEIASPELSLSKEKLSSELGDLLFSLAQFARLVGIDSEEALRTTCDRFVKRFEHMEENAPTDILSLPRDDKEKLWQKAKAAEPKT